MKQHLDLTTTDDYIAAHREEFRAEATEALKRFTPDDRELAASLTTQYATVDDVLKAWTEQIEPMYRDLEAKRSDVRFRKSLMTHVGFHENDATRMVDHIVEVRKQSLLDEVLDNVYHSDIEEPPYQREYALNLLSQPMNEVESFKQRYEQFFEALDGAEQHNITLCDPHGSWIERQKTAMLVNKERQQTAKEEDERLETIDINLQTLTTHDPLLRVILDKKISIVHLLDLASKYNKQLDSLPDEKQKSSTDRLQLFERVTAPFRMQEVERIASSHHIHNLKSLSVVQSEISDILLEVCSATPTHRNRLLLDVQRHTRLTQERDLILLIQRNREHFYEGNS